MKSVAVRCICTLIAKLLFCRAGGHKKCERLEMLFRVCSEAACGIKSHAFCFAVADIHPSTSIGVLKESIAMLPLVHRTVPHRLSSIVNVNGIAGLELRFSRNAFIQQQTQHKLDTLAGWCGRRRSRVFIFGGLELEPFYNNSPGRHPATCIEMVTSWARLCRHNRRNG